MWDFSPCKVTPSVASLVSVCEQQQQQQRDRPPLSCVWSEACVSAADAHAQKRMRKAVRGPDDALKKTAGGAQVGGKGCQGGPGPDPYVILMVAAVQIWLLFMLLPPSEVRLDGIFLAGITQTALCASLVRAIGHQ